MSSRFLATRSFLSYYSSCPKYSQLPPFFSTSRRSIGRYGYSYYQDFKIYKDNLLVSPCRTFYSGFSSSNDQDLMNKKCVPCQSKDLRPMAEEAANELLLQVEGWNLINENGAMMLHREWKVKTFTKGLEFFQLVADIAEAEGHHPDLHLVGWNNVQINIRTHSVGGLTENDFILASKINSLKVEHLLRKKTEIPLPCMWVCGAGSRTMSPLPPSTFHSFLGQNQRSGFPQNKQHMRKLGYPIIHHSQAGMSQEHQQNPGESNLNGSQRAQSQRSHQFCGSPATK